MFNKSNQINDFFLSFDDMNKTKYLEINDLLMNNGTCREEMYEKHIYTRGVKKAD